MRSLRFNNLSLNPPIDAVQEVSLLRNSFSTEYGQGQAVVSIVTKSGTNRLNGSVSEFFRNDSLDAKNYFAAAKPEYKRNQFGATSGGPLVREPRLRVRRVRGAAQRPRAGRSWAAVPNPAFLSRRLLELSPRRFVDPLTGQPFPGNHHSRVPLLEVCANPGADDSRAE